MLFILTPNMFIIAFRFCLFQLDNADIEEKKGEKKNEIFFDDFKEAVLDFELMCKNTSPDKTRKYMVLVNITNVPLLLIILYPIFYIM